jgi:hypothetical protein
LLPILLLLATSLCAHPLANRRYRVEPAADGAVTVTELGGETWTFRGDFVVQMARQDPRPAMRPGNIPHVNYNVVTWIAPKAAGDKALQAVAISSASAGDGFDDRILQGDTRQRTADVFAAAPTVRVKATGAGRAGDAIRFTYAAQAAFDLTAALTVPAGDGEPVLAFTLTPKEEAWFSTGYVGAPAVPPADAAEVWQPFIWQEKRFPQLSYLTAAFECPLPATLVRRGDTTVGVVVDADEFPFQPLPLLENSRFGVALRNPAGEAQPMVFAPMLGGAGSHRKPGEALTFKLRLFVGRGGISTAFESLSRRLYGFRDFRRNSISSVNETLDREIAYGLSRYSWFVDELKGCAYSTDVPGAVKNVSSLNPLELALVTDDEEIFRKRAYPIVEYMLSREKFLFSLDPKQKIQSPSRALTGPCAPVSELAALYGITKGASPVFRRLAESLAAKNRTLNLDDVSEGASWQNQLALFRETGEDRYLAGARRGADAYLAARVDRPAQDFNTPGLFFWPSFAPQWIDLLRLYEVTKEPRYLAAARQGARQYTMFTWMAPRVPDAGITVNPGGNAPVYWYLQGKGFKPMHAPEARVPAWRLSEMGLTPESSGTMSGHRAIFMANYAPWMLRLSALTGDALLHDVARAALVGRSRNFPGYHINTARTNIYERADYPLHEHTALSVNSFHYNHIWPHMSMLLDFLVTDAFARSGGKIDFPAHYIEGYAYLQNKFYGDRPGRFYDRRDAVLWMPRQLLRTGSVELNYIAARGDGRLYLAFANQSAVPVTTGVQMNLQLLPGLARQDLSIRVLSGDGGDTDAVVRDGRFNVTVAARGQTAIEIDGIRITPRFQDKLLKANASQAWRADYLELPFGRARAMLLNFGPEQQTAYVYLQADDGEFSDVTLTYADESGTRTLHDDAYPFEFTVKVPPTAAEFRFHLSGRTTDGRTLTSADAKLHR